MKYVLKESFSEEAKQAIIEFLIKEGYGTYAKRLQHFKFIVADKYFGMYIPVAAMVPESGEIVINPSMFDENSVNGDHEKVMKQLSVVVRHELLHFLLVHEKRLFDHLKKIDPVKFDALYHNASIHEIGNYAMDYDISNVGYDEEDKEVVKLMTINNEVVGGLLVDSDHPDWVNKTMEEMFDLLKKQVEAQKRTINIKKVTHDQEYIDSYNKIISELDGKLTIQELDSLIADATSNKDIINPKTGEILLGAGE